MERNSEERIVQLMDQIIKLLEEFNEALWIDGLTRFKNDFVNLTHSKTRQEAASVIMKVIAGGMGSLADVSLSKNGVYQDDKTKLLHTLRRQLFNECLLFRAH